MKRVSDILESAFSKSVYNTLAISKSWKCVVGDFIASSTIPTMIKNKVLYIGVSDHILKNELYYMKDEIIEKLKVKGFDVDDVKFFLSYNIPVDKVRKVSREISDKEREVVDRYSKIIKDEGLREKFRNAMLGFFSRYSLADFINDNLDIE
ncbi:DUF721 domain-containing protein [Deferribacter autotrophicus]|uniref:DUF721 domain-containing protein n=1 Tax=Deferribacter autotrophicus TaxID=500465 RepID=A0A5A8F8H2_9BACT|nr:DUF721 domain-containing protein [Deferribacter autotrophicus]KAA0258513.1 DUF721 domain-containing protein [Deferribacter autotrophicus]